MMATALIDTRIPTAITKSTTGTTVRPASTALAAGINAAAEFGEGSRSALGMPCSAAPVHQSSAAEAQYRAGRSAANAANARLNRAVERRIVRKLMRRVAASDEVAQRYCSSTVAERLIAVLAATAGVFLLGTYLQELLWAALGVATVLALGISAAEP